MLPSRPHDELPTLPSLYYDFQELCAQTYPRDFIPHVSLVIRLDCHAEHSRALALQAIDVFPEQKFTYTVLAAENHGQGVRVARERSYRTRSTLLRITEQRHERPGGGRQHLSGSTLESLGFPPQESISRCLLASRREFPTGG